MKRIAMARVGVLVGLMAASPAFASEPTRRVWTVDGVQREALVAKPKNHGGPKNHAGHAPVIFAFHGHGGTMQKMSRHEFHKLWPQAIVVYPQGLLTPSFRDPQGKRPGWQNRTGLQGDRDLKFFDAMLRTMIEVENGDANRVYSTGHSNGGGLTYLLWSARRDKFAAVAVSAGGGSSAWNLQPLPVFHLAGKADSIVPFISQEKTISRISGANAVSDKSSILPGIGLQWESPYQTPVVTYIHDGGHKFVSDGASRIIKFFRRHTRPDGGYPEGDERSRKSSAPNRFAEFDTNGDGHLSTQELPHPNLFRRLDADGDGVVTRQETVAVFGPIPTGKTAKD